MNFWPIAEKVLSYVCHVVVVLIAYDAIPYDSRWLGALLLVLYCTWRLQNGLMARSIHSGTLGLFLKMNNFRLGYMETEAYGDLSVFESAFGSSNKRVYFGNKEGVISPEGEKVLLNENELVQKNLALIAKGYGYYADLSFFSILRLCGVWLLISL